MVEVLYTTVIIGDGPYYGMVPDFSLMASGSTRDAVNSELQKLTDEAVAVAQRYGTAIPVATAKNVLEAKWKGNYFFSSVVVRVKK